MSNHTNPNNPTVDRSDAEVKRTSKFLSLLLRHRPETIGLQLDENGWADIDELITLANADDRNDLDRDLIEVVVATNNKKRFVISDDGQRIRASQGHSIEVDLEFEPVAPPAELFHGTATRFLGSIMDTGLDPRSRQHVHMTADGSTAVDVGSRHGKPVVLVIDAAAMVEAGHDFFLSANGVWLTDHVPSQFLALRG